MGEFNDVWPGVISQQTHSGTLPDALFPSNHQVLHNTMQMIDKIFHLKTISYVGTILNARVSAVRTQLPEVTIRKAGRPV